MNSLSLERGKRDVEQHLPWLKISWKYGSGKFRPKIQDLRSKRAAGISDIAASP